MIVSTSLNHTHLKVFLNRGRGNCLWRMEIDGMPQIAIFLVVYCELHYGGILVLLNKNTGLKFGLVEHIPGAQYMLGEKN